MELTHITGTLPVNPVMPTPESGVRPDEGGRLGTRPGHDGSSAANDWNELTSHAAQAGLEVRLETLPDSSVTLIKMVDPRTGQVVREYPSEGLAEALAGIRKQAAARLDRKA